MQCISRIPLSYRRKAKTPRWRGSRYIQIVRFRRCHRGAALPSMNGLSNFLCSFQYQIQKTAQKSKKYVIPRFPKEPSLTGTPLL